MYQCLCICKQFGTNWFTTVMGVGIVAALTFASPIEIPFQHEVGIALFLLLNLVFVLASTLWIGRWLLHAREALDDFRHPTRALFYGAFAMGINVVGNDYYLIGVHIMPPAIALAISKVIWVIGAAVSMFTVIVIPYLLFVEHEVETKDTLASWLIPVVPPIVAAFTGVNLIPLWGSASVQFGITAVIIAMFGITFFLFIMVSSLVYSRLVYHKRLSGAAAPSLWVEIGPIGMSMATFSTLPLKTQSIFGPYLSVLHTFGVIFSMAMWGVGVWWILMSAMHTLLHVSKKGDGIPFNLGWWSYVFPIGSFTTGTYALAHLMDFPFFRIAGLIQLIVLWLFFLVVVIRTVRGTIDGSLIDWRQSSVTHGMATSSGHRLARWMK